MAASLIFLSLFPPCPPQKTKKKEKNVLWPTSAACDMNAGYLYLLFFFSFAVSCFEVSAFCLQHLFSARTWPISQKGFVESLEVAIIISISLKIAVIHVLCSLFFTLAGQLTGHKSFLYGRFPFSALTAHKAEGLVRPSHLINIVIVK